MKRRIELTVAEVMPMAAEVLETQGMAGRQNIPARITALLDSALAIFKQLAEPKGMLEEIPVSGFGALYDGNGKNSEECPVPGLVARADALAVFAATMGDALMNKSSELFAHGGPALGYMLDAVNSAGAERLGRLMCRKFLELLPEEKHRGKMLKAQYYCPGHCGWHLSGQEQLFRMLHPEEIGIQVTSSWAMYPTKSISGVLVAGEMEIHRFKPAFAFCEVCKEHKCIQRLRLLESES
ncbi:MAG: vitamin B12-dependent methionine synthase, activation domain protein [Acidobacteria bacterium]|jgi:hypothetical protein|nr:vitamin B12-dependent methionine synthase, activation domain protein [Acidobacteriota bacterium]